MNKLWLGFDLGAAIAAPILHVNDKGQVEYEPNFSQVRPRPAPPLGGAPQRMLLAAPSGSQLRSVSGPAHFSSGHHELGSSVREAQARLVASKAENRVLLVLFPGRAPQHLHPGSVYAFPSRS